eukprot:4155442-Prymnesium_polylepis.1
MALLCGQLLEGREGGRRGRRDHRGADSALPVGVALAGSKRSLRPPRKRIAPGIARACVGRPVTSCADL